MERLLGKITRIVDERGFGFIAKDGDPGRGDYFFGASCLDAGVEFYALRPGDRVTFEHQDSPKGKRAVNVQKESH